MDGGTTDDGWTPDHGHPISSSCETNGSDELKRITSDESPRSVALSGAIPLACVQNNDTRLALVKPTWSPSCMLRMSKYHVLCFCFHRQKFPYPSVEDERFDYSFILLFVLFISTQLPLLVGT